MTAHNRRVAPPQVPREKRQHKEGSASFYATRVRSRSHWLLAVRAISGILLAGGSSFAAAWYVHKFVTTSPRFAVTSLQVIGSVRHSTSAIASESGIAVGSNVFSIDLNSARQKILADPWIVDARLSRRLPGTVVVRVVERRAAARVALGELFLATAEGEMFKKLEAGDPTELPLITGLDPQAVAEDRTVAARAIERGLQLAAEYERRAVAKRAPLQEIRVDPEGGYTLLSDRAGLELVLGGPPFERKLDQVARVVAEIDKRGMRAEAIMLDNDTRPERAVVRLR